MKKLIFISSLLTLCLFSWSAPHGKFGKTLKWRYDTESQTLYVTGTGELPYPIWAKKIYKDYYSSKEPPYTLGDAQLVKGKTQWKVKNVVLSEGITSVADKVFKNCTFDEFTMPVSLEKIDGTSSITIGKLHYNGSLEQWLNLQVADKCLHGAYRVSKVFVAGKDLDGSIVIPQSVTHLPAYAFYHREITELVLPNTIKSVDKNAFLKSYILKIDFLGTADEWCITDFSSASKYLKGELLFRGKQLPASLRLSDKVQKIPAYAFYRQTQLTDVVLPSGIISIGEKAFRGCKGINTITLPAKLQTIGDSAFYATQLTEIDLPQSLQYIGVAAFAYTNISRVTWRIPDYSGNVKIFDRGDINHFTFTSSVRTIPSGLCQIMNRLWYLTIEEGVRTISSDAFNSSAIVKLELPKSVSYIGYGAFSECTNLRLVSIPNPACSIQDNSFSNCNLLTQKPYPGGTVDDKRHKEKLPEIWVKDIDGDAVEISSKFQDGHITMLMFDATWCMPSRRLTKYVEENIEQWKQQYPDLQVIMIYSHDSSPEKVSTIGEVYFDSNEPNTNVMKKLVGSNTYPIVVFIDKYGKSVAGMKSASYWQHIEECIQKAADSK